MLKIMLTIAMSFMLVLIIACANVEEIKELAPDAVGLEGSGKEFNILATTPMLGEFVKQVAGEDVYVGVLMPYAVDPHTFEPSPKDVAKINEADLVFHVGLKYENIALTKLLKNSVKSGHSLIEIGSKINAIEFKNDNHDDEDKHDDHDHGTLDPHFWFDPNRVALAVGEIKKELINLDPENRISYELSANSYVEKLKMLDQQIDALIQTIPFDNRKIVTTHESLGYLENRYGLEVLVTVIPNITTEDGVTPKQLVEVIEQIKEYEIKVIFLEAESPTKSAEIVAKETNVSLVTGLWVETLKVNQSYIDFLKTNVDLIVGNLKNQ